MTDEEIRISYKYAKYKGQQIGILCQLTLKSKEEILDILGIDPKDVPKDQGTMSWLTDDRSKKKLTADEKAEIERLWAEGMGYRRISGEIGRCPQTVESYLRRKYGRAKR